MGIRQSGRGREELFVTTKVGRHDLAAADVRRSAEASLARLQLDYVDLLLIHWPNIDVPLAETLAAFAQLVDEGKVRYIGISTRRFRFGRVRGTKTTSIMKEAHP